VDRRGENGIACRD